MIKKRLISVWMGARMKGKGGAADGWEEGQGVPVTHSCRGFPVRESWSGV